MSEADHGDQEPAPESPDRTQKVCPIKIRIITCHICNSDISDLPVDTDNPSCHLVVSGRLMANTHMAVVHPEEFHKATGQDPKERAMHYQKVFYEMVSSN